MNLKQLLFLKAANGSGGGSSYEDTTLVGNPVQFRTSIAKPIKSVTVPFTFTQEGSGDPYPAGGWKNKFNKDDAIRKDGYYLDVDGVENTSQVSGYLENYIPVTPNTNYIVSCNEQADNVRAIYFYTNEKVWIERTSSADAGQSIQFYTPSNCYFIRLQYYIATSFNQWQLELGTTATSYAPYSNIRPISGVSRFTITHNNSAIDVVFPAEPGTVYGGSLDVISGVMTIDTEYHVYTGAAGENWSAENVSAGKNFYIPTPSNWTRNTNATTLACNVAKSENIFGSGVAKISSAGNFNVCIGDLIGVSTASAFKEWLASNNIQIAVKLIEPYKVQIDPTKITALKGDNTIYVDIPTNISVTYTDKFSYELYDETLYPLTKGWVHGGDGTTGSSNTNKKTSDYVPCERAAGKLITLNKRPNGGNPGFAFYTSESVESFISGDKNGGVEAGTPWTVWVPDTAKYMRFTVPLDATDISVKIEKTTDLYDAELYPITNGRYIDDTGGVNWNSGCAATINYIPCEIAAGKKILLNKRPTGRIVPCIAFYSATTDGFISAVKNNGESANPWIVDVPANAKYVRISTLPDATDLSLIVLK